MPEHRRYRLRTPDQLTDAQRALYEQIVGGPRAGQTATVPIADEHGALLGPFGLMTLAPAIGGAVQELGSVLRFRSALPSAVREAAILRVSVHHDCAFEWFAHERAAAAAGLTVAQLRALADGQLPSGLDDDAMTALTAVGALLAHGRLSDDEYEQAVTTLGEPLLAELVWLVGYYSMLALSLAVFEPPNPLAAGEDTR